MKRTTKLIAALLSLVTLLTVCAIPAAAYSYPMACTIYYKNESGEQIAPAVSFQTDATSPTTTAFPSPSIDGYILKNSSDASVTFSMMDKYFPASNYIRNGTATYTVVYEKGYYVTIDYLYEDGSTAAPRYQALYKSGDKFSISSPSVTGYTPSPTFYSGTVGSSNYYRWATYHPKVYTVSYNANGGYNAPASQSKYYGDTLTLTSSTPTCTGYTFMGWSTSSSSTSASYLPGSTFSGNYNLTLYAVWKIKSYSLSYDANTGSGAPATQTKKYGTSLTISSVIPTKTGYTFVGWSTYSTATSASYAPGSTWSGNYNATLYAVWEREGYTVSYNANGGSAAPSSQTKEYGLPLTLSSQVPNRTGYTFKGWALYSNSTRVKYSPGDTYSSDSNIILYAVWSPEIYTVSFDANGGYGAPSSVDKTYGVDLTLPNDTPNRNGYEFIGWSNSPTAYSADYYPGGVYEAEWENTLYAVWEFINYDISVSDLTVSDGNPYQYDTITVDCRLDSWDINNAYYNIPLSFYIDGDLILSTTVDFAPYGVELISFQFNVGSLVGQHTIEAWINWGDYYNEVDPTNNTDIVSFNVEVLTSLSTEIVEPNSDYLAGNTVISSFTVANDGSSDITPADGMDFLFRVSTYDANGNEVTVQTQTWNNVVIPAGGTNLVYFKWTIPTDAAGKTYNCSGTMNPDGLGYESNLNDNTASFSRLIRNNGYSQTPDTGYERTASDNYQANPAVPASTTGKATWNMWKYENGEFILESFGIQVTSQNPTVRPSSACASATYLSGIWTMKSGYGITLNWNPELIAVAYSKLPDSSAYTAAQNVFATFPEYAYATNENEYRTLFYEYNGYQFEENPNADSNARLHYIPVYVGNGNYTVCATATQIWTPAGMISATRHANTITLNGSIYDDYYVGN